LYETAGSLLFDRFAELSFVGMVTTRMSACK